MYEIEPPAVYLHERALASPEGRARIERMLAHVHCPAPPEVVDDARLNDVSLARDWPVRGWREENEGLIHDTLAAARPDVISMDLLGWMHPERLDAVLDPSLLDPRFLEAMRVLFGDGPPGPQYYPSSKHIFPHDLRAEVYSFFLERIRALDRDVRVALCNETTDMWRELGPRLGMTPENYVCGCGPDSVPTNPLLARAGPRPARGFTPA